MRRKLLLLCMFLGLVNVLWAQKYDSLIISEVNVISDQTSSNSYVEIVNMGNSDVDLMDIRFLITGRQNDDIDPKVDTVFDPFNSGVQERSFRLWEGAVEDPILEPGETFVLAIALDFIWTMQNMREPGYGNARPMNPDIYPNADFLAHLQEKDGIELTRYAHIQDSTTWGPDSLYYNDQYGSNVTRTLNSINSTQLCFAMTYYWNDGEDSITIDQVKGMFDDGGSNSDGPWVVAGVDDATSRCILYRKYTIKKGERDFTLRGGGSTGLDDSDWIPIVWPLGDNWRDRWWTVGNHGDYKLDENTLTPKAGSGVTVDYAGKSITVPWGTRRLDDIMRNMEYTPGVAWVYELNGNVEDSLYRSAKIGDRLAINVVGTTLYTDTFDIVVADPLESDNIVVPFDHMNEDPGPVTLNTQNGILAWPRVTNDMITGGGYGLPSGLRTDTLFKYLEKPPDAEWAIEFVDGSNRADLRNGDKLVVTAKDGSVKEYTLEVQPFQANFNANLASITWPDNSLSAVEKFLGGWIGEKGDTIPNFGPNTSGYRIFLPADHVGIPALVAKTQDPNASVSVKRANSFDGSVEDRTTVFKVTSEAGDTVTRDYKVEFVKRQDPAKQPANHMLPLVSETSRAIQSSHYLEILNSGNRVMDLSWYLLSGFEGIDPTAAILQDYEADLGNWFDRYTRYVPGRKWVDSTTWQITPSILDEDLNVNTLVQPGDVFLMGEIFGDSHVLEADGYNADGEWPVPEKLDVQFRNQFSEWQPETDTIPTYQNPWGEPTDSKQTPFQNTFNKDWFMFKIVNDSVRNGTKAVDDPNDFELIEYLGVEDGRWYAAGIRQTQRHVLIRKPGIIRPNPFIPSDAPEGSFGDNLENSEWLVRNVDYFSSRNAPGSAPFNLEADLGVHFFDDPTFYVPTVKAKIYKVSDGFTMAETIEGIMTGTTVEQFLGNLFKADTGQALTVHSGADDSELGMDAVLSNDDYLLVEAADSSWTNQQLTEKTMYQSKYILSISDQGLSSDAVLTSDMYTITVDDAVGTIAGMEYETTLSDVIDNVSVPAGAILTVVDENGLYLSLTAINYGGQYVDATADYNVYFEIVAENTVTTILYQLQPNVADSVVFVTSAVFEVSQDQLLINFVPDNTKVDALKDKVIPSPGATLMVIDKNGFERTEGGIALDDRLIVTSADGELSKTYFLGLIDEESIEASINLAYLTSDVYEVDQVNYVVSYVGSPTVSDFLANVNPAEGATAVVVDQNGNDKTTGNIAEDDMVKVTSGSGKIEVNYSLSQNVVGIQPSQINNIHLYPNPTSSEINIVGLESGSRIQVYNSIGSKVVDVYSRYDQQQTISLDREPAGLYFIYISTDDVPVGIYKAIKQ